MKKFLMVYALLLGASVSYGQSSTVGFELRPIITVELSDSNYRVSTPFTDSLSLRKEYYIEKSKENDLVVVPILKLTKFVNRHRIYARKPEL
jgi:hypothetical protein